MFSSSYYEAYWKKIISCKNSSVKTFTIVLLFLSLTTQRVLGQLSDDFSDGDFLRNPAWSGSTNNFIVNASGQLQLNQSVAGTSYLTIPFSNELEIVEWQFYISQTFAGSATNFGRIYLASSQANLTSSLNGYYLQFGEGGSNDAIELFRQTGLASTSVCRTTNGGIASAFGARIKVTRTNEGVWTIFADYSGKTNFILQASGTDVTHTSSAYFGVRCTYTVTNASRFLYDDILISALRAPDITAPLVSSLTVNSSKEISISFSEPVDATLAEDEHNYSIADTNIYPASATLETDEKTVRLSFEASFANGVSQTLTIQNVKDVAGNEMARSSHEFLFFQPVPVNFKDIIVSEIFADPSPLVGLPEAEFIEVYNRSDDPFDLQGWKISDGNSAAPLSRILLLPKTYLIICASSQTTFFTAFGKVMGIASFPSLNNTGESLTIKDNLGVTIDSVRYSNEWYKDDEKKDGGWSLEIIDPDNICSESQNWISSEDAAGGTPGKANSVFANKPDLTGPKLLSVFPLDESTLLLKFDEKLDKILPSLGSFILTPAREIAGVSFTDNTLTTLSVRLAEPLQGGIRYKIDVKDIYDCPGNVLERVFGTSSLALPEKAEVNDIVINEILFNPKSTGVDFVEIYNQSEKFINLKQWKITNLDNEVAVNHEIVTDDNILLEPHSYLVLTEDGNILKGEYLQAMEETFFEMNLPSFPDEQGSVALINGEDKIIDAFSYVDSFHSPLLKDEEGVSLERINFTIGSAEKENWKSASSVSGFATPGYLNSNSREFGIITQDIQIEPEIFVPQNGQPDFTQIKYNFERGGYIANVRILDPQGREIKRLANNELLGTDGFFRWDGDQENGSKARIGSYMVWFEVFDTTGEVKTFRKRVVIAEEF